MKVSAASNFQVLGRHVIAEYYGCSPELLDDLAGLGDQMVTAARRAGATPVKQEFHHFAPHGISGVVIIMESHLTIHTWPELRYAAVDFFTCGEHTDPLLAHEYLSQALGATSSHHVMLQRGLEDQPVGIGNLWSARLAAGVELRAIRAVQPGADKTPDLWLSDEQEDQISALRVQKVLHAGKTAFAHVEIVDTEAHGRLLSLDGMIQSAAADEAQYHESLVAPAFVLAPRALRRVAILGGGEGATLREVLRFAEVERCVMIDLDPELVALCREHLPTWSDGAFADPRAELRCEDALSFLQRAASSGDKFDLIVCDLPDAEDGTPLAQLYATSFFALLASCLAPGGFYAGHVGSFQMAPPVLGPAAIVSAAAPCFAGLAAYSCFIPSFGAEWVFAVASRDHELPQLTAAEVDERLARRRDRPCRTYDGVTHHRLFSLAKPMRLAFDSAKASAAR
ncbi:MAG TPA: adenosylmethionine decarboxylase [Pseudomonadota bacterium]|nr:adenosylmethionine decarboxylase [Pseudomonadota bacterium]